MRRAVLLAPLASLMLVGCGVAAFTEPKTNPVIEDRVSGAVATLATTAERRIVMIPLIGENKGKFCAEPSPDAVESLAASFKGALEIGAKVENQGEGKLKGEIARAISTSVAALTKRTQGLQLYRDGVFALCQSRMNGFMSNKEYRIALRFLRDAAVKLIDKEISAANWNAAPTVVIQAPEAPDSN